MSEQSSADENQVRQADEASPFWKLLVQYLEACQRLKEAAEIIEDLTRQLDLLDLPRDVADFRQSAWIHIQESLFDGPVPGGLIPFVANDLAKDAEELLSRYLGPDWRRFAHQDSTQRAGAPPTGSDLGHLRAQLEGMAAKGNVDPEWLRLMREALDLVLDHPGDAIMRLRDVKERLLEFYKGGNVVFDAEAIQGIDNPTVKSHLYVVHSLSNLAAHWSADELGPAQAYTAVASLLRALQWFQETA